MRKRDNFNKGTSNSVISRVFNIHLSTLGYWKNSKDFRNKFLQLLKSFSIDNLNVIGKSEELVKFGRAIYFPHNKTKYIEFKTGNIVTAEHRYFNELIMNECCISIRDFIDSEYNKTFNEIKLPKNYDINSFIIIKPFTIIFTTESL